MLWAPQTLELCISNGILKSCLQKILLILLHRYKNNNVRKNIGLLKSGHDCLIEVMEKINTDYKRRT